MLKAIAALCLLTLTLGLPTIGQAQRHTVTLLNPTTTTYEVAIFEGALMTAPPPTWNIIPDFALLNADTQGESTCVTGAPWGSGAWGIEAGSFQDATGRATDRRIEAFRFVTNQRSGYLYARDGQSRWALARYIQGTAWPGSLCGAPIPWRVPPPVNVTRGDTPITLDIQHTIDTHNLLTDDDSWLMFAVNMWFNSDDAPKRLVVDIVLSHECNFDPLCRIRNFESDDAFHYMTRVVPQANALDADTAVTVDVRQVVQDALNATYLNESDGGALGPSYNAQTLNLVQLEYVIEVYNAEGAASVDYLGLRTE